MNLNLLNKHSCLTHLNDVRRSATKFLVAVPIIALFSTQTLFGWVNATSTFTNLSSGSWPNDDGYVNGWAGWSAGTYRPTYNFGIHTLTFEGSNSPSSGHGGGYMGTQNVTINAGNVVFKPNATLQVGNNINTNTASVIFNAPVNMGSNSTINIKGKSTLILNKGLSGTGNINSDGYLEANDASKDFSVNSLYIGGSSKINAKDFKANTLNLWESKTLNLLGVKGNITIGTLTNSRSGLVHTLYTATIDTNANVTINTINLNNYGGGRGLYVNTHGFGDVVVNGPIKVNGAVGGAGLAGSIATFTLNGKNVTINSALTLGYYNKLTAMGVGNFTAKYVYVGGGLAAGGDSILDFQYMNGKTSIDTLELLTASIYGKNFTIKNLIERKGASRSVFYTNIGSSSIGTLTLDPGGSNADNTILEFRGGGEALDITTADIKDWAVLDASKINKLTIGTLKSAYATIKAKELVVNNATFSNNKTYLFANTTTSNGTISLDNKAELWIKSSQTFNADTLNMNNGSKLYAASNNGGMTGTTTIQHIKFNNSQIYANNLITHDISIVNNGDVYLSPNSTYTNQGDLNISDGSHLYIHGANFANNGQLNITLGADPSKNASNIISVLDGTFSFDMTKYTTTKPAGDTSGLTSITAPKAAINVVINPSGIASGQTYNLLTTKNGIVFKDNSTSYTPTSAQYNTYKTQLKNRIYFTISDGSTLAVDYWFSDDNKSIGFKYDNGKHYVNAYPFINPGTWVFGIGSGAAAFGSIGGVPAASGLAKDYTLRLQEHPYYNKITKQNEATVYYIKDLNYNNYGNRGAKFTVDATGSDFALGKNQDIGGVGGTVNIAPHTMKSNMVVKANNIYLGGKITLGDGALISGHLDLQSKGKVLGDDSSSILKVRNHSSLKASGTNFDYAGTILLYGNSTVTDEVGMDLSAITGKITIGTIEAYAARPNSIDLNAGIKMSNFEVKNLIIGKGNGGTLNNYYSEFTTNIGTSKIDNLTLLAGTSSADQAGLKFSGGGTSLTIGKADIGAWSFLDASKVTTTYIDKQLILPYSTKIPLDSGNHGVQFNNLYLNKDSVMNYGGNSDLTIKGNFTNQNALLNITPYGSTIKTIEVFGDATFYFNDDKTTNSGIASPLIKITDISGLKLNQPYVILKASGTITYIYTNKSGKQTKSSDSTDDANNLYNEMADRIALIKSDGSIDNDVDKKVDDKQISFTVHEADSNPNPYNPNDIRYWFFKKGSQKWIDDINDIGPGVMDWFQTLMINKHNGLWAKDRVFSNDLAYFIRIGKTLQSTMGQLSSVNRKNNSTSATRLATDVSKTNRLVKLSNTQSQAPTFAEMIRALKNEKFASNDSVNSLYKFANRNTYKNNLWANAIGAASFVQGGNSTLYGINVGYDRYINHVIIGGYLAYATGSYNGDIIRNNSYNANAGFYARAYAGDSEFDISASETVGFNKEELYSQDLILSILNQKYHYMTFTTNVNVNYGYLFAISNKSIILKPQIGLSYYFIAASGIKGNVASQEYQDLKVQANPDYKQNIALNLAIETRQYFNQSSYWYFIAGISRDLVLKSKGDDEVRFIGNNTLSYKKAEQLNTYGSVMAGGEMELFKRIYVNLGLGAKAGIAYKDINISGNVGVRYVF